MFRVRNTWWFPSSPPYELQGIRCSNGGKHTYDHLDGMFQCSKPLMIFCVPYYLELRCVTLNTLNSVVAWKCTALESIYTCMYSKTHKFKVGKTIILWKWNWSWTLSNFKILPTCQPNSSEMESLLFGSLDSFNLGVFESTYLTVWAPKLHIKEDRSKRQIPFLSSPLLLTPASLTLTLGVTS